MSVAAVQIRIIPKRMLDEKEAAATYGRPLKRFKSECPVIPVVPKRRSPLGRRASGFLD